MPYALPALGALATVFFVIADALVVGFILYELTPWLEKIPYVGPWLAGQVKSLTQAMSNACGHALEGVDHLVGGAFHSMSRFIDHTYRQFGSHAKAILETATIVGALVSAYHAIKWLVNHLSHAHAADTPRIKRLEKEYRGIEHTLKRLERELRGIDETGVRAKLRSLDQQLQAIEDQAIPALRKAEGATAGELAGLEQWLGIDINTNKLSWLAGLGAAALAALGLGGLGCDSNPFKNNKNACGLWSDLSGLLALAAGIIAVEDFDTLVHEMQAIEQGAADVFKQLVGLP